MMRIRMRMRYIIVARIYMAGRDHSNASSAASAHSHAHAHAHAALQATQRAMSTAMMAVTMMAAMGAATAAVQRDAAGQCIVGRLYGTDHSAAAHDVRQLIGLDIKVLRLYRRTQVSVEHIESPKRAVHDLQHSWPQNNKVDLIAIAKLRLPQDISTFKAIETIVVECIDALVNLAICS